MDSLHSHTSEGVLFCHSLIFWAPCTYGSHGKLKIMIIRFSMMNVYLHLTKMQVKDIHIITNCQGHYSPVSMFKGLLSREVLLIWLPGCESPEPDKKATFILELWLCAVHVWITSQVHTLKANSLGPWSACYRPLFGGLIPNTAPMYKARHAHKCLCTVLPKYSEIQVLPGITSCRLMKDNNQQLIWIVY